MLSRAGGVRGECLVLRQSIKSHGPRMERCQLAFAAFLVEGEIKGQTLELEALRSYPMGKIRRNVCLRWSPGLRAEKEHGRARRSQATAEPTAPEYNNRVRPRVAET